MWMERKNFIAQLIYRFVVCVCCLSVCLRVYVDGTAARQAGDNSTTARDRSRQTETWVTNRRCDLRVEQSRQVRTMAHGSKPDRANRLRSESARLTVGRGRETTSLTLAVGLESNG